MDANTKIAINVSMANLAVYSSPKMSNSVKVLQPDHETHSVIGATSSDTQHLVTPLSFEH